MTHKKVPQATAETSTFVGKDKKKKTDSKFTCLIDSNVGLTGTLTGPTGVQTGLTGASGVPGNSSKNKTKPSFKKSWPCTTEKGLLRRRRSSPMKQRKPELLRTTPKPPR